MKLIVVSLMAIFLTGCVTTVPVTAKFPEVPSVLKERCPPLNKTNDGATLSDISKTITQNYTKYHECSLKNDSWIEWYETQRTIFEGVK